MNTASNTTMNTIYFMNSNAASSLRAGKSHSENSNTPTTSHISSNSVNIVQSYPKTSLCFMIIFTLLLCALMMFMYYRPSKKQKEEEGFPVTYE